MQILRVILFLAIVLVVVGAGATGCSRQESEWRHVRDQDTVAGYEDYLQRRPLGPHADEARARLRALRDERAWERALRLGAPEAFQQYIGAYPDGRFAEQARERLADFLLAQAPSAGPDEAGASATPPVVATVQTPRPAAPSAPVPVAAAKPSPAGTGGMTRVPAGKPVPPPAPVEATGKTSPAPLAAPASRPPAVTTAVASRRGPAPVAPAAAGGGWRVQLGAFGSGEAAARSAWQQLRAAHRGELTGLEPEIDRLERGGHTLWRLRAGRVDRERAREVCAALRARGAACFVLAP